MRALQKLAFEVMHCLKQVLEHQQRVQIQQQGLAAPSIAHYRIEVSFSVDALAYLFKLLINAGIVIAEPKSQLFLFIACSFKTPGTAKGCLSPHSFSNKYNQTVQATAKTVRAALIRMLKQLDKEFDLA